MRSRTMLTTGVGVIILFLLCQSAANGQKHLTAVKQTGVSIGCGRLTFPDLTVVTGSITSTDQYVAEIKNIGPCAAPKSRLGIFSDGPTATRLVLVATANIPALAAGQTYHCKIKAKTGTYKAVYKTKTTGRRFIIDDQNAIHEGDENNNGFSVTP